MLKVIRLPAPIGTTKMYSVNGHAYLVLPPRRFLTPPTATEWEEAQRKLSEHAAAQKRRMVIRFPAPKSR